MTITKEVILEILNTPGKWNLIDFIINHYPDGYKDINDIYTDCMNKHAYDYQLVYKILGLAINIGLIVFFEIAKQQATYMKVDVAYRVEEFKKFKERFSDLSVEQFESRVIVNEAINDALFQYSFIPLYKHGLFKHLFKTAAFQEEFNLRIATYIYDVLLENPELNNKLLESTF